MATLNHAESRRLYSWWWDSHISPKNSKWLQENLADMDSNVKAMIRLIEEDAESFAQRAEMFYKKRPELMKLVEEFYRAYRALAERYDQCTGALRQAHRKMAEAFPNEILLEFSDEPPSGYSSIDAGPDILEMNIGLFLPDDLRHVLPTSKITLKQLQNMFTGRELTEELKFKEEEGKCSECKLLLKENQDLKNQIISELTRAHEAESEVHRLKEESTRASIEKENAVSRCEEAKARVSYLEHENSYMQGDLEKIKHADERCMALEKSNQVLVSELEQLKRRIIEQQKEIDMKKEDLQNLSITLKDEQLGRIKCEMACHSNEKQLVECQEKLKDTQLSEMRLEEALQKIRWENRKLNEEKLSSALKIINLQDEIISLRGLKGKLQTELNIQVEEKAAIRQELNDLKEDRNDLERRYHALMEEMQVINSNIQFLQVMISDLKDGNFELKQTIKNHENEKYHLMNLQQVGKMSEKNATNIISDANNELERLREKIRTLEDSCYYLHGRVSINQAEKARLMSHVEAVSQNMEKISSEKAFLENSLFDTNAEFDALRGKLKSLEESSLSLHNEKSSLLLEKMALVSQVESISQSLKNLERRYAALEEKHSTLQEEKNSTLQQVEEMQELLKLEREEHNAFLQSSNSQLSGLVNQIQHLQVEGRQREKELELEQIKIMNAQIEIFVLQRCLCDMKQGNLILSIGSQKNQEALRCSDKLILELEKECVSQENKIKSLKEHNEKWRGWIRLLMNLLKIDLEYISLEDVEDEVLMQLILREIRCLLRTISEAQEEKQHLLLEKSVVVSLLKQFGAYLEDLRAEKAALEKDCKKVNEEFGLLKNKNDGVCIMNQQLKEMLQASNQREKTLKAEVDILYQQLSGLQDVHCSLQIKISSMHEENHIVSNKLHHMRYEKDELEKENNILISDVMALDCFSLILRSLLDERGCELQILSNERNQLHKAQKDIDEEITLINEKIILLQAESSHVKESIPELEKSRSPDEEGKNDATNLCKKMNLKIDTRMPLIDENMDLSWTNFHMQPERKEEDASCKETSVLHVHHENNTVKGEVNGPQKDVDQLKRRELYLASTRKNRTDEQSSCDVEITSVMTDSSLTTASTKSFHTKVHELIKTYQMFEQKSMVQMHSLRGDITQKNVTINEQKKKLNVLEKENKGLKADINAYLLLLRSLWDDISLLEEQAVSLAKRHTSTKNQKKKDIQVKSSSKKSQELSENYGAAKMLGPVKLQDLHSKIKILQKVVMDTGRLLELERLDSTTSMSSAWKETERLPLKDAQQQEKTKMKYELVAKDLQRYIVLNSSHDRNSNLSGRLLKDKDAEESTDEVSELCRTTEESCSKQNQKASLVVPEDDTIVHHHVEGVDDGGYSLIELVAEKELAVDKLVLSTKPESFQEWSRRVMQRLCSDGQRLLVLQACVKELQKNIEEFEKINHPMTSELVPVKEQLEEAEGSISKLIDINHKLISKVEYVPAATDSLIIEKEDDGSISRRQITDRVRKVSEKITRLEVEMQKIQYSMLKADKEGNMNRRKVVDQRSGILLKEYIYGKRNSRRQKKGSCGCIRPKANGD